MKKRFLFMLLTCTLSARLAATPLDVMLGSRGIGMGGAYVAIADDQSAAYWNPAGLSQVDNVSIMESNLMYQDVTGLNVNYMSLSVPIENVGTVSGSWLLTSIGLEEGWNYATNAPLSTSKANEQTFVLGIGRQLWKDLGIFKRTSVGFNINRYTYSTTIDKSSGVGLDLGFMTHFYDGFSLGLMGRNLGADIGGEPIDPEARLGLAYTRPFGGIHKITGAVDGLYTMNRDYGNGTIPAQSNVKVFGGLEYAVNLKGFEIAARGGINGLARNSLSTYGYTLGAGFKFHGQTVEYAFEGRTQADETIGNEHHLSVIFNLSPMIKWSRIALDTTAPTVTFKGDSVLKISTHDGYYIDSGCTAFDKVSGDLTSKIVVDAQVNPMVAGTYSISYSVADEAGNKAIRKRKVIVTAPDTIPPVITVQGDSIITLAVGETYTEHGVKVVDNVDTVFPNLTTSGTVNVSKVGENIITYAVSDRAGNVATKQRKVVVIPVLFKRYGIPAEKPLGTMKKTFTRVDVEGAGPDLSKIVDLKLDWALEDSSLRDMTFDASVKPRTISLKDKIQQSFSGRTPKAIVINSGIAGLDGEYYVTDKDGNFVMVRADGGVAIVFKP